MTAAVEAGSPLRLAGPFKGLASFGDSELDELLFFGREREREVIAANLVASRLTVLYGASGVGKTSVLAAGVARALRALPECPLVVVHAGWSEPAPGGLARAVAAAAGVDAGPLGETVEVACALRGELYLLLDQIEQYFVYHGSDPALGEAIAELVGRSELPVHVLLGVREDALARLDAFKSSVAGLLANRLRLEHLTRDDARRAIVGPVERYGELVPEHRGLAVEPALVEAVLDGVRAGTVVQDGRGRGVAGRSTSDRVEAPYLQVVMQRLWETEQAEGSRVLRLATLHRLGGPQRIVEEHLERALGTLTPGQKRLAARIFNHLVTPSGTKIAHGAADLARYAGAAETELEPVLAELARARVLRPVGENGGAAHEIYHDVLADAVLGWRSRYEAEQALEQERDAARRRHRRLIVVAIAALAVAGAMVVVSAYALRQRHEARKQSALSRLRADDARAAAREARAGELAATALGAMDENPARSVRDALAAALLDPSPRTEEVLRDALLVDRLVSATNAGAPPRGVAYLRDGRRLLVAGADGSVRLVDGRTGRVVRRLVPGAAGRQSVVAPDGSAAVVFGAGIAAAAFSGDGSTVATLSRRGAVTVGPTAGGATRRLDVPRADRLVLDASGARLFVGDAGGGGAVFDRAGKRILTLPPGQAAAFAFSPVARVFAAGGADAAVRVWNPRRGGLRVLHGHVGPIRALAFSPAGSTLASASRDDTARLWSVADGRLLATLNGHTNWVDGVAFSPSGDAVATWSRDGTARVWKVSRGAPGAPLATLPASRGEAVRAAAWGGRRLVATAAADGSVQTWNVETQPLLAELAHVPARLNGVASVDGRIVARSARRSWTIDRRTGRILSRGAAGPRTAGAPGVTVEARGSDLIVRRGGKPLTVPLHAPVVAVAAGHGGTVAAGAAGSQVTLVGPSGSRTTLASPGGRVTSVAFAPDGRRVAAGTRAGTVEVWRVDGRHLRTFRPHSDAVADAQFSPDGRWIATAGPQTASLIDTSDGRVLLHLRGHRGRLSGVTFDPTGRRIYTVGVDGTVRVYRCDICGTLPVLEAAARRRLRTDH